MSSVPGPPINSPRPTMRDVAAAAGVALKTVSRVFNDVPSVDPELAARTRLAAAKLGYRPNLTASTLRRRDRRTATIGLLLEDVGNPFSAAVHRAVEDYARGRESLVLTGSLDEDPVRERELVHTLTGRQIDGLIIVPTGADQSYLDADQRAGTRIVFLDRPPTALRADAVVSDNRAGARSALDHLIAAGHRRIAYLGDRPSIYTARERLRGYTDGLRSAGIGSCGDLVCEGVRTDVDAAGLTSRLLGLADPPTALFTSQNVVTIGAARALRSAGAQHRVALVGFDDIALADSLDPALTVVVQDAAELGRRATELLFAQIDGAPVDGSVRFVPTRLLPRGSGEIAGPAA